MLNNLVTAARGVIPVLASFNESQAENRRGATIAITKIGWGIPPVVIQVNEEKQPDKDFGTKPNKHLVYAVLKCLFPIQHPFYKGSGGNLRLCQETKWTVGNSELPGGSFAHNDWVVAVSGFNPAEIDEAGALAIHIGAGNLKSLVSQTLVSGRENKIYLREYSKLMAAVLGSTLEKP
jgi:hypothetical protein